MESFFARISRTLNRALDKKWRLLWILAIGFLFSLFLLVFKINFKFDLASTTSPIILNFIKTNSWAIVFSALLTIVGLFVTVLTILSVAFKIDLPNTFKMAVKMWPELILIELLVGLIVIPFYGLLIIPGIIITTRLIFAPYLKISANLTGFKALAVSSNLVRGKTWLVIYNTALFSVLTKSILWLLQKIILLLAIQINSSLVAPLTLITAPLATALTAILTVIFLQIMFEELSVGHDLNYINSEQTKFYKTSLIISLILIMTAAIGLEVWWFKKAPKVTSVASQTNTSSVSATPTSRDATRLADVAVIRLALADFAKKFKRYPITLDLLVPEFINSSPTDPTTGKTYYYDSGGVGYTLAFALETDVANIKKGSHLATPLGIDPDTRIIPSLAPAAETEPNNATDTAVTRPFPDNPPLP